MIIFMMFLKNLTQRIFLLKVRNSLPNRFGHALNAKLENKYALHIFMAIIIFSFAYASAEIGVSRFSPDSWAYLELSKTVFNGDFYKFNTLRSYFSSEYSASFPLGYPVAIAITSLLIGSNPMIAVAINIVAAIATGYVLFFICRQIKLPALACFSIISALLFYRYYIDEIFSGRAIPVAIFLYAVSFYFFIRRRPVISGVFLGLSVLVRFDFLVYALLFQTAALMVTRWQPRQNFLLLFGFVIGIFPWIFFSFTHFGKIWISDNSWVAISALPAFVLDYPAAPIISAFQKPIMWLMRVISNVPPLLRSIIRGSLNIPLLILFFAYVIANWLRFGKENRNKFLLLFAIISLSTIPYLLTGYFDYRYYSLPFISLSMALVYLTYKTNNEVIFGVDCFGLSLISLIFASVLGIFFLSKDISTANTRFEDVKSEAAQIRSLHYCHQQNSMNTYIFARGDLAAKYGALTGMRAAMLPSNLDRMTLEEKNAYYDRMKPYVFVENISGDGKCITQ